MQAKKRQRYSAIPLCLLPIQGFVLVNNVLDDLKTSPAPDISAIRIMRNGENIMTVHRVP
jgi:hypothetical protein